jgi:hypothetical protein
VGLTGFVVTISPLSSLRAITYSVASRMACTDLYMRIRTLGFLLKASSNARDRVTAVFRGRLIMAIVLIRLPGVF